MKPKTNRPFTREYGYIYLSRLLGAGSSKLAEALSLRSDIEQICLMTAEDWKATKLLTEGELRRVERINCESIYETLDYCAAHDIRIITPEDDEYPNSLHQIENPPAVLFAKGQRLDSSAPSIGIVGARKSTEFGQKAAYSLAAKLALSGFTIVSGGAVGIDDMAHIGAMNAGGKTIVVLGCGIDSDYLKKQEPLRKRATEQGTLLSEFEPLKSATRYTFPIRNRLISALSSGVAVIEAGRKSGALITATYAMEQGKEVFALPGNIDNPQYEGTNELLRDGAIPLLSVQDIILVYLGRFSDKLKTDVVLSTEIKHGYVVEAERLSEKPIKKRSVANKKEFISEANQSNIIETLPKSGTFTGSSTAQKVYDAFSETTELADTLSNRSGVNGSAFITAITELELLGYIKAVPVGRYTRLK